MLRFVVIEIDRGLRPFRIVGFTIDPIAQHFDDRGKEKCLDNKCQLS